MTKSDKPGNDRSIFSFWRRGRQVRELSDYHEGDIRSGAPVAVTGGSAVVGDIFAPAVNVAGLLYGSVVAREIIIEPSGQVWGDVYAIRVRIEPGGRIQGWVSDISEADYQSLYVDAAVPEESGFSEPSELPADIRPEESHLPKRREQINALRNLRSELGEALTARSELERAFEERVAQSAGDHMVRANALEAEVSAMQKAMEKLERECAEKEGELEALKAQLKQQSEELGASRDRAAERERALEELREISVKREEEIGQLRESRGEIERRMQARRHEVEELNGRIESLEAALQASIQSETEQEQSLLRWQELANDGQERVETLQQEVASLKEALTFDPNELAMLRQRIQQMAEELQMSLSALKQQEEAMVTLRDQFEQTDEHWRLALAELQAKDAEMATLQEQFKLLKENWREATQSADVFQGEFLWEKADRESVQSVLEEMKQGANVKEKRLRQLQKNLVDKEKAQAKNQAEIEQLKTAIEAAEVKFGQQKAELAKLRAQLARRDIQLQEAEQVANEQLAQLRSQIQEQVRLIGQMKQVTSERIQELEGQLAQASKRGGNVV